MDGQFLVRQIYDDEITYNLIGAAVEILSEFVDNFLKLKSNIYFPQYQWWSKLMINSIHLINLNWSELDVIEIDSHLMET